MNNKQQELMKHLRGILHEIDMQCIEDEGFDNEIEGLNIFSRNINDIVEDIERIH